MTDLLDDIPPPPPLPPRRRRWPFVAGAALVVAAGAVAALTLGGGSDHPSSWDPRVADLAAFVERERGLSFEHPVHVDFLADDAFRRLVTEEEELDEEDRAQLESAEAMLRAVGLISGDVDLEEIGDELVGDGVVGLYRFEDDRVIVRGSTLDDQRRSTIVHELTHALQDQHFAVGDREPELSGEGAALTAVVEADAEAVEEEWRASLSSDAREKLEAADEDQAEGADFEGVPDVFVELMAFPYAFGPDLLATVLADKGQRGRDELFVTPPTTEEHIVLPETYLAGQRAEQVPTPALEDGETAIEDSEGDFGMLSLLVVLAERIDFFTAWQAVQGWAGDATVAFERDDVTCVRTVVKFDSGEQAAAFGSAFASWATGLDSASHRVSGRAVEFESCDPGTAADRGRAEGHVGAIQGLALRRSIIESFEASGAPTEAAACVADGLLRRVGTDRLAELDAVLTENPEDSAAAEIAEAATAVVPSCR